jgi:hypothetical protein
MELVKQETKNSMRLKKKKKWKQIPIDEMENVWESKGVIFKLFKCIPLLGIWSPKMYCKFGAKFGRYKIKPFSNWT